MFVGGLFIYSSSRNIGLRLLSYRRQTAFVVISRGVKSKRGITIVTIQYWLKAIFLFFFLGGGGGGTVNMGQLDLIQNPW